MVRDPSIVSPSLTGVFIGGGHNKHGTGSRCTLPKQCRPPSPRRRWRCDRSSYKRSLFSRIRDSQMHYLTGPETIEHRTTASRHRLGFMWSRTTPGWASPSISVSCFPCTCRRWRERDEWSWDGLLLVNHSQVLTYPPTSNGRSRVDSILRMAQNEDGSETQPVEKMRKLVTRPTLDAALVIRRSARPPSGQPRAVLKRRCLAKSPRRPMQRRR